MQPKTREIRRASFCSADCTGFIKFKTVPPGGKGKGGGVEVGIKFQPWKYFGQLINHVPGSESTQAIACFMTEIVQGPLNSFYKQNFT